jgi:hypothetical protein
MLFRRSGSVTEATRPPVATPPPRRRNLRAFLKKWTIPIIGGITPVGLILVNVAVYINDHVQDLRWGIAVAAFLSGMMLNTWVALSLYRWVKRHFPDWSLTQEQNQEMVLVLGMFVITVISVLSAVFCFYGLGDAKHLPNKETFLYGAVQIAWPVFAKLFVDRDAEKAKRASATALPAGATPGGPGAAQRPSSASGSGYVPPPYLPPS